MDFLTQAFWFDQLEMVGRLLLAAICGFIIGFERKNRNKEAGVRTHLIVALASCLMMEISKYGFGDIGKADGARLAAQVVSGIGFLGAGMIFVHKNSIKGLTTAAGVWATSGIGMAVGAGMYIIGVLTTLIMVVLQIVLHKNPKFLTHNMSETIVFEAHDTPDSIGFIKEVLSKHNFVCEGVSIAKISDDIIRVEVHVTYHESLDMFEFTNEVFKDSKIKSVYSGEGIVR